VLVVSQEGKLLGRILTGELTANCCFGGADGATLYMTADMWLCRIQTKTKGAGF
jgi:gluconolactonase